MKWRDACGSLLPISTSILAGSRFSNRYARIIMYELMEAMHNQVPAVVSRQFVDDLAQGAYGTRSEVVSDITRAAEMIKDFVGKTQLKLSIKSTLVSSCPKASKTIIAALSALGVRVACGLQVADLGVEATVG